MFSYKTSSIEFYSIKEFSSIKGSWSQFDLDFPNLPPRSTESHIYVFFNRKTKRFSISIRTN